MNFAKNIPTLILTLICVSSLSAAPVTDEAISLELKKLARSNLRALQERNVNVLVDSVYPPALAMLGGPREATKLAQQKMRQFEEKGYEVEKIEVSDPTQIESADDGRLFTVIPTLYVLKNDEERVTCRSCMVGVRDAATKKWGFLDAGVIGHTAVKMLLPDLPATVKVPPVEKPVREKLVAENSPPTTKPSPTPAKKKSR
jgi:hypothetical protein